MNCRRPALIIVIALSCAAGAQISGKDSYPQFRGLAALPGSGFAVRPDGRIGFTGAMGISTPVAYSISNWDVVIGGSNISTDRKFRMLDLEGRGETANSGNGTAQILLGIPLGERGDLTVGHMFLSGIGDNATNLQWTPAGQTGPVRYAIGVQDIGGGGGTQGEGPDGEDPGSSRSVFAVGTYQATPDTYVTLGVGGARFSPAFGSVSYGFSPDFKLIAEHDSIAWNVAAAVNLGVFSGNVRPGKPVQGALTVGLIRGRNAYWSVGFAF